MDEEKFDDTHLVDMYQCAKCGGLISGSDIKIENGLPYIVEGCIIPSEKTLIPSRCPHCGRKIEFVTWRFQGK